MKAEQEAMLTEALRRQRRHAHAPRPPAWRWWDREPFDDVTRHGPEYRCGGWFGEVPEHQRMRYRRAIADLEREGLLSTWARWGRRLSHLRLTPAGERLARELLAAARLERRRQRAAAQGET